MKSLRNTLLVSLLLSLAACDGGSGPSSGTAGGRITLGQDQYSHDFGTHVVYVNALTTDLLPQDVAKDYGLSRSSNRVMLNVSVHRRLEQGTEAVLATVQVVAKNLSNQVKGIDIREFRDGVEGIYYIGEVPVGHGETLVFDIDVTPAGLNEPFLLSFRKQFVTQQ